MRLVLWTLEALMWWQSFYMEVTAESGRCARAFRGTLIAQCEEAERGPRPGLHDQNFPEN